MATLEQNFESQNLNIRLRMYPFIEKQFGIQTNELGKYPKMQLTCFPELLISGFPASVI